MPLSAGDKLGPYEILAPIGAGGMGEVYRARDLKLDREVAVKFLPDAMARDPRRLARFEREAKVLAALNHPNIAHIYSIEDRALIMELVPGKTLKGPLPLDTALNHAAQIADALEAAHGKGIVHRDLKPGNIMVTPDGIVKVLDFGLAAQTREAGSPDGNPEESPTLTIGATQAGVILGTAAYMSPEQARGQPVDRRSDIWSFGVVLMEMLTGERIFTGQTFSDVLAGVLSQEPDLTRAPAKVQRLLKSCLQKDPKQRLQAIGDWKLLLDDQPQTATAESKKISALPWALAAVAIAAALAVSFVHLRESPPPSLRPLRFTIPLPQKANFTLTGGISLSPDGQMLAFAAISPDSVTRLWVRPLEALDARPLPGTEGIDGTGNADSTTLAWSPDSRSLVFQNGATLKRIELAGGPSQTICECRGIGAVWTRDAVILLGSARGILKVSAVGGTPAAVTTVNAKDGEMRHAYPVLLPDGRHFLYLRDYQEASRDGIYEGDLNTAVAAQASQRLLATSSSFAYAPSADPARGRILFLRGQALMAQIWDANRSSLSGDPFPVADQVSAYTPTSAIPGASLVRISASPNGTLAYRTGSSLELQLTWMDRGGNRVGTVADRSRYTALVLSQDGTKAGVRRTDASGKRDLWVLDLAQGTSTRLTSDPGDPGAPLFSPNGSRVAFGSVRHTGQEVYMKASSGAGTEEVLMSALPEGTENLTLTDWSRDGRFIIFFVNSPKTGDDIWVLPMDGDRKPFPFLRTEFGEFAARLSPDGHWIGYLSNESGRREIYVKKFIPEPDGGASAAAGKWIISRNGGVGMVHWRRDGKELYYLSADSKMMAVDVTTGPEFHAGTPKALFSVPEEFLRISTTPGNSADVSPDGKRFLFALPVEQSQPEDIKLVLNWEFSLKK